jgi:hypothetical protein
MLSTAIDYTSGLLEGLRCDIEVKCVFHSDFCSRLLDRRQKSQKCAFEARE